MDCPACGRELDDGARFCGCCGTPVSGGADESISPLPENDATAGGGNQKPQQGSKRRRNNVIAGVVTGAVVVAWIIFAGVTTNWFGLVERPVYVISSVNVISAEDGEDGSDALTYEYENDHAGNRTAEHIIASDRGTTSSDYYSYDSDGYLVSRHADYENGQEETFEHELDSQGNIISQTSSNGTEWEFEYYSSGGISTITEYQPDDDSYWSYTVDTFDTDGYLTRHEVHIWSSSTNAYGEEDDEWCTDEYKYSWTRSASGELVGVDVENRYWRDSDNKELQEPVTVHYEVLCDSDGNIVQFSDQAFKYSVAYVKISAPSKNAKMSAKLAVFRELEAAW